MRQMTVSNIAVAGHGRQTLSSQAVANGLSRGLSTSRSLDLVRMNIQTLINKDIDGLLRKYLDKFFQPAIVNIRKNLGDGSVTEEHILQVCIQMLNDAKAQYSSRITSKSDVNIETPADGRRQQSVCHTPFNANSKRKDNEHEADNSGKHRKKVLRTVTSVLPGTPTPIKVVKLEGIRRDGPKWDPNRINRSTLLIMGARANKVLGFGQTRGRLYTKHPELLKYSGDTEDKEWLSRNNLMPPTGGIAYLLLLEDVRELAESEDYRHNPNVLLHELRGFEAPEFMLSKIRNFVASARTDGREDFTYHYCESLSRCGQPMDNPPHTTISQQFTNFNHEQQVLQDTLLYSLNKYHPTQSVLAPMYVTSANSVPCTDMF